MRDIREQDRHLVLVYSNTREPLPPGWTNPPLKSYNYIHVAERHGRSDLFHGDGVKPTPNRGYSISVIPGSTDRYKYGPEQTAVTYANGKYTYTKYRVKEHWTGKARLKEAAYPMIGVDPYNAYLPLVSQSIIDECENKALAKLKAQEADLGTTLAELGELKGLMISKFVELLRIFLLVKRGKYAQARERMRLRKQDAYINRGETLSKAWLTLQLGWLPLLNEIFGLQEAIRTIADSDELYVRVTAVVERDQTRFHPEYSFEGTNVQGCKIGIVAKVDPKFNFMLKRLGISNPYSLAWELLPLSFVFDYFVNVGRFLDLTNATVGLDYVSSYTTTWTKCVGKVVRTGWPGGAGWEGQSINFAVDSFSSLRTPGFQFPSANLTLGSGVNPYRALMIAALGSAQGRW